MIDFRRNGPWKPWYLWRPGQLAVRAWRSCRAIPSDYRPISSAWGGVVVANPTTSVGKSLWTTAVHDLAVSEVLARLVSPGALVIDAGAHVGYMTTLAAAAAGPSGRVMAFEPHPDLFAVLQRTVTLSNAANNIAPVIARNAALGDCEGQATLSVPDGFDTNDGVSRVRSVSYQGAAIPIRIHTIDQVLDGEPAEVLKIDVEGDEPRVLRGAATSLKAHRIHHVIFEDFDGHDSQSRRLLESFGYQTYAIGWSVRGPRLRPAGEGSLAKTYEAPSYLATLDPDGALRRCAASGWHVLRPRLGKTA